MKFKGFCFSLVFIAFICCQGYGQIYSNAYGDKHNPSLIFLHGGPGYNSYSFEYTAAEQLVEKGYHVILYDRLGCGRSDAPDEIDQYNFQDAAKRLLEIYEKYDVQRANLIGHSFGGTLALKFLMEYPDKVERVILLSAPISYQEVFKTILSNCREVYKERDTTQLKYLEIVREMDTSSMMYAGYCFQHARNCGLYNTPKPLANAKRFVQELKNSENSALLSDMKREPFTGFFRNEQYTTLEVTEDLKDISGRNEVYGIYGEHDGLFDEDHLKRIESLVGEDHFYLVENASHSVFIDRRDRFIDILNEIVKK